MGPGKALELLIKHILLNVGFSEVRSDGLYIFDGSAGQMVQGLGDAHNADVLLEPPVQTPFYTPTRLLVECKDYVRPVGLNTLRSALGLREDINHFDIVDKDELEARRRNRRSGIVQVHQRYLYQVVVASTSGFTSAAQNFALTHRIPLIEVNKMPFWADFCDVARQVYGTGTARGHQISGLREHLFTDKIYEIASRSAVSITNDGQLLFLYRDTDNRNEEAFCDDTYSLHWSSPDKPWVLRCGEMDYYFQLPKRIREYWLKNSRSDLDRKVNAISCKASMFSHMVVYYSDEYGLPKIKMLSIDRFMLNNAMKRLLEEE